MKRYIVLGLVVVLGLSSCANANKERVLLFIKHGKSRDIEFHLQQEVDVMTNTLEEAGFKVIVATESGETIKDSLQKPALKPDLKLADVRVSDYVGIIMPCMGSVILYESATPAEISLAKEAVFQGKPIAAQHGAVHILKQAGVLEGKKHSFRFEGVIQDGSLITSSFCPAITKRYGDPDGTPELTKLFIEIIKD